MSQYTTQIRYICEVESGLTESVGYNDADNVIGTAAPKIFGFSYPIFDEDYKSILQNKILEHYYTREIAFESVGLFKLKLRTKMREIMPKYNNLYSSLKNITIDKLFNDTDYTILNNSDRTQNAIVNKLTDSTDNIENNAQSNSDTDTVNNDITVSDTARNSSENEKRTGTETRDTDSNLDSETDITSESMNRFSDTPQGSIVDLESGAYLTDARKINDTSNTVSNSTQSGTDVLTLDTDKDITRNEDEHANIENDFTGNESRETTTHSNTKQKREINEDTESEIKDITDYISKVSGKMRGVSYMELLNEFKNSLFDVDMLIIDELEDLFFALY